MHRTSKTFLSLLFILTIVFFVGCARQFSVIPQMKSYDFTVVDKFGAIYVTPTTDSRTALDKSGKIPSGCLFDENRGITILGDKNYRNELLLEINKHLKTALLESGLFTGVKNDNPNEADYTFKSNLDQFHVVLDETKALDTQACVGGLIGSLIASTIDVEAVTEIRITGVLFKGEEEIWRKSISKSSLMIDDYSNTSLNAERSMGDAIGSCCKDLVTELATYLASK